MGLQKSSAERTALPPKDLRKKTRRPRRTDDQSHARQQLRVFLNHGWNKRQKRTHWTRRQDQTDDEGQREGEISGTDIHDGLYQGTMEPEYEPARESGENGN